MKITIEIGKPLLCGRCPFYSYVPYSCHNERGMESKCSMGYMAKEDMRDRNYTHLLYVGCRLGEDLEKEAAEIKSAAQTLLNLINKYPGNSTEVNFHGTILHSDIGYVVEFCDDIIENL